MGPLPPREPARYKAAARGMYVRQRRDPLVVPDRPSLFRLAGLLTISVARLHTVLHTTYSYSHFSNVVCELRFNTLHQPLLAGPRGSPTVQELDTATRKLESTPAV